MSENEFDESIENTIISENEETNIYTKNLLVIINTNSGKGDSEKTFFTQVLPYFEEHTNYKIEYCVSRYCNHVDYYISQNKDIINQYDSLIILGGDGMFHLTLNSLIKNKVDIPLGIIPSGSGNGLVKSIFYERVRDEYTVFDCYNLIKEYRIKSIDTISVSSNTGNLTSFLAISWGIISDLDINTEFMRFLGNIRFDIGAVWNILR